METNSENWQSTLQQIVDESQNVQIPGLEDDEDEFEDERNVPSENREEVDPFDVLGDISSQIKLALEDAHAKATRDAYWG